MISKHIKIFTGLIFIFLMFLSLAFTVQNNQKIKGISSTAIDTIIKRNIKSDSLIIKVQQTEKPTNSSWIDGSTLVSLLALCISTASVTISYYTFKIQRKHNISSLKPYIILYPYDYESQIKIEIKNQGLGVAFIIDCQVINGSESRPDIFSWLPERLPSGVNYEDYYIGSEKFAIPPNTSVNFLDIPIDKSKIEQIRVRNNIRTMLSLLTLRISYRDIYDNIYVLEESLSFFKRVNNENSHHLYI